MQSERLANVSEQFEKFWIFLAVIKLYSFIFDNIFHPKKYSKKFEKVEHQFYLFLHSNSRLRDSNKNFELFELERRMLHVKCYLVDFFA